MTQNDDELDLRPYLRAVFRQWWLIAALIGLAAVVAMILSFNQARTYTTTSTILIVRSKPALSLADRFPTVNEPIDQNSRMLAVLSIAKSDSLALRVIDAMGEELPAENRDIAALQGSIEVENQGDAILISATATDPELAAAIANTWANQLVQAVNTAYSGELPLTEIQSQLETTRQDYETSQAALEGFLQSNQISLLEKQVAEAQTLLDKTSGDRPWQIAYYSQRQQLMDQVIAQGQALAEQIRNGSASSAGNLGDAVAILRARATAFGLIQTPPLTFEQAEKTDAAFQTTQQQVQITTAPVQAEALPGLTLTVQASDLATGENNVASAYLSDLETLVAQARSEKEKAAEQLEALAQDVLSNQEDPVIGESAGRLQGLEARLESESARLKELTSQRDLAWSAYLALAQKETEIRNASQTYSQVGIASPALPAEQAAGRGTLMKMLLAGALGAMLATGWILITTWWRLSGLGPLRKTGLPPAETAQK